MDNNSNESKELMDSFKFIGSLTKELFQTNKVIVPTIAGATADAATVGATTFVGSMAGGPVGAVTGGAVGTVLLGLSKFLGYSSNYKSIANVIEEDLTEEERSDLYERISKEIYKYETVTNYSSNQSTDSAVLDAAVKECKKTVEKNPVAIGTITKVVKETLAKKNICFD